MEINDHTELLNVSAAFLSQQRLESAGIPSAKNSINTGVHDLRHHRLTWRVAGEPFGHRIET